MRHMKQWMSQLHKKAGNHFKTDGFTLVEVILSIMILAIVSGVVIKLFMTSKDLGDQVKLADMATFEAANAIEIAKASDGPFDSLMQPFFEGAEVEPDGFLCYYNEDFELTENHLEAIYVMSVTFSEAGTPLIVDEFFEDEGRQVVSALYDITVTVKIMDTDEVVTRQISSHYYTFVR